MQIFSHFTANNIKIIELPFPRELVLESYLIENSDVLSLDKDYTKPQILGAELALQGARKKGDGRIDILASYDNEIFAIIELKLGELTEQHLKQLEDYLRQSQKVQELIKEQLKEKSHAEGDRDTTNIMGILVGEAIDDDLAKKIKAGYYFENDSNEKIAIAALTIRRFQDEKGPIYIWTDAYFKSNSKDMTKYKFKDIEYAKNRFVLAVVKGYVEDHPTIKYSELEKVFPSNLQGGGNHVFRTLEDANERENGRYYFMQPAEIIQLDDGKIAVCSHWYKTKGNTNFNRFLNHIKGIDEIKKYL
ncbi:MAG: hypothetical protein K0U39_06345 [Alphaproteobacteria bacterium]|nr:hypothetical protein [Alphaproteobacteria bacterium]